MGKRFINKKQLCHIKFVTSCLKTIQRIFNTVIYEQGYPDAILFFPNDIAICCSPAAVIGSFRQNYVVMQLACSVTKSLQCRLGKAKKATRTGVRRGPAQVALRSAKLKPSNSVWVQTPVELLNSYSMVLLD